MRRLVPGRPLAARRLPAGSGRPRRSAASAPQFSRPGPAARRGHRARRERVQGRAARVIEFLPFIIFTLPAGVWVDRLPRKPILVIGDLGRAAPLASLPIAYAFDALRSGSSTWSASSSASARSSSTSPTSRTSPRSWSATSSSRELEARGLRSASQIAGPGVAGAMITPSRRPSPSSSTRSASSSRRSSSSDPEEEVLPAREPAPGRRSRMRGELREGLRFVLGHPHLRAISVCTGISNFFGSSCSRS